MHGNTHLPGSSWPWEIHGPQLGMYNQCYFGTPHRGPPVAPQGGPNIKIGTVLNLHSYGLTTMGGTEL